MAASKSPSLHRISFEGGRRAWPLVGLVLAPCLLGCATQAQTGQLLSAAGTAAVIAGAMVADDGCYGGYERSYDRNGRPCGGGGMSGSEKAGIAIAVAGLATAAIGNALQEDAARLDARRRVSRTTYTTPTVLPPPGYAPVGTFHPFAPPPLVVQTESCTCHEPEAAPEEPPCNEAGEESATPGAEGSEVNEHEEPPATPASCPCAPPAAPAPASSTPSEPAGEAAPEGAPGEAAPESAPAPPAP